MAKPEVLEVWEEADEIQDLPARSRNRSVGEKYPKYRRMFGIKLGRWRQYILSSWRLVRAER